MNNIIRSLIKNYVKEYEQKSEICTKWQEPLVSFANSNHEYISQLTEIVVSDHVMPKDIIENHKTIIAYFIPFDENLAKTNNGGSIASSQWALAYEETNALFTVLNSYIIEELNKMGYKAGVSPQATTYDHDILKSKWSQRHIAKIAGLGTFGINNMLITEKGCCGRVSTIVTDLEVEYDNPINEEYCLYKSNGSCGVCVTKCPGDALKSKFIS